jgi:hypothetical protein
VAELGSYGRRFALTIDAADPGIDRTLVVGKEKEPRAPRDGFPGVGGIGSSGVPAGQARYYGGDKNGGPEGPPSCYSCLPRQISAPHKA